MAKDKKMPKDNNCIMVIDDDGSDLELIQRAVRFTAATDRIVCMNSGKKALAYLQGEGEFGDRAAHPYPSMLITDIKMPEVDGFEILEDLQNNPTRAIIPAIILSASEDPDDIRTAYKLGAFSYFVKPYQYEDLCELVNTLFLYWQLNKAPLKDSSGKLIATNSNGKLGARYAFPN